MARCSGATAPEGAPFTTRSSRSSAPPAPRAIVSMGRRILRSCESSCVTSDTATITSTRRWSVSSRSMPHELRDPEHPPRLMPGVTALLDALESRDDVLLGLLTGNIPDGAAAKLRAVGIAPERFKVAAYGSDHERRPELPAIAQRRARE